MGTEMRRISRTCCAVLVVLCALANEVRAATPEDKAAAEALFDTALTLMRQGKNAEACPKLEQSQRIDPAIGTLLYLGECYENLGRSASAWATFREALSEARTARQLERANMAQERIARLEPTLSRVRIDVAPETRAIPGLQILRSGTVVDASLWGVSVPADPGLMLIEAKADGYEPWSTRIKLAKNGDIQSVVVPVLRASESTTPAAAQDFQARPSSVIATTSTEKPDSGVPSDRPVQRWRTTGLVLGGVGIAGLGVGAYFGVRALTKNNEALDYCPSGDTCVDQRGISRTEEAKDAATISNILIGVGAAATIGGAVLYFAGPRERREQRARVEIGPVIGSQQAGINVRGAFQ